MDLWRSALRAVMFVQRANEWRGRKENGARKIEVFFFVDRARFHSVFSALAKQIASYTSEIYGLNNSLYYLGLPEGRSW